MTVSVFEEKAQSESIKHYSVCICKEGSPEFELGQAVAQKMYNKAWDTESYSSKGDYAVVVFMKTRKTWEPIANLNCALKNSRKKLPCESIFTGQPWVEEGINNDNQLAEICGLAIDDLTPPEMRRAVLIMLSMGLQAIAVHSNTRWLLTIQHEYLIRILRKSLGLPFTKTDSTVTKDASLPNDQYWNQTVMPCLYILDSRDQVTRAACESFFYYLSSLNIGLQITNKVSSGQQSYSGFKRQWQSLKQPTTTPA